MVWFTGLWDFTPWDLQRRWVTYHHFWSPCFRDREAGAQRVIIDPFLFPSVFLAVRTHLYPNSQLGKERHARYTQFKREVLLGDRRAKERTEHGRLPGRKQVMGEATAVCLYRWNHGVGAQVSRALFGLMGTLQWAWHQLDIELKIFWGITPNLYLFSFVCFFMLTLNITLVAFTKLKYRWFTMSCWFLLYSRVTQW